MKDLLFHQFQRYETTKLLINAMRTGKSHTILEVGSGNHANLEKFLPEDKILYLDNVLSEENQQNPKFILGDVTEMDFREESYDFIVALDVLEHIPKAKRDAFFSAITKTARLGVVLSVPTEHIENIYNDRLLDTVFRSIGKQPPVWVGEHEEQGLPAEKDILDSLKRSFGNHVDVFYHGNREMFTLMVYLEALASNSTIMWNFFSNLNNYYNDYMYYNDLVIKSEDAVKSYYVCSKSSELGEKAKSALFEKLCENDHAVQQNIVKVSRFIDWFNSYDFLKRESAEINNKLSDIQTHTNSKADELFIYTNNIHEDINTLSNEMNDMYSGLARLLNTSVSNMSDRRDEMHSSLTHNIQLSSAQLTDTLNKRLDDIQLSSVQLADTLNKRLDDLQLGLIQLTDTINDSIIKRGIRKIKKIFKK